MNNSKKSIQENNINISPSGLQSINLQNYHISEDLGKKILNLQETNPIESMKKTNIDSKSYFSVKEINKSII